MIDFNSNRRLETTARNILKGIVCDVPDCNLTPAEPGDTLCDLHMREVSKAMDEWLANKPGGDND